MHYYKKDVIIITLHEKLMNKEIAEKITKKIEPLTKLKFAVCDTDGYVMSKSKKFDVKKDPLKVKKSKRAITLNHKGNAFGYLYFDEKEKKIKEIEKIFKSMVELYIDQLIFLEDIPNRERHLDKYIYDLLHCNKEEESIDAEAKAFGINIKKPYVAIVIMVGGESKDQLCATEITGEEKEEHIIRLKRKITSSLDSFYTRHKDNVAAYVGENIFVVLKDLGEEKDISENIEQFKNTINSIHYIVRNEVREPVTIGVGGYYQGIFGLKQSFGEAMLTARLGEQVWGEDKMYHFDSFGVVAPLVEGGDEKRENYSKDLFSKFSNRDETLRTLNTFFDADMSLTKTATKLKIHRNTLVYRLDKITETLDLDPRIFEDAVQIKITLLFGNFLSGGAA